MREQHHYGGAERADNDEHLQSQRVNSFYLLAVSAEARLGDEYGDCKRQSAGRYHIEPDEDVIGGVEICHARVAENVAYRYAEKHADHLVQHIGKGEYGNTGEKQIPIILYLFGL